MQKLLAMADTLHCLGSAACLGDKAWLFNLALQPHTTANYYQKWTFNKGRSNPDSCWKVHQHHKAVISCLAVGLFDPD